MDGVAADEAPLARRIPPTVLETAEIASRHFNVRSALHPLDFMFWFIFDDPDRVRKEDAPILYFESGRQVAVFLRELLNEPASKSALSSRVDGNAPVSVLEFAAGYGRASRHFAAELPNVELTACDVHREAVEFLTATLGINACLSSAVPEQLSTGAKFDVVFALSFFTHMPRATWTRWLAALADQLTPGGLLIFTAHGELSQRLMGVKELEPDGFFFAPWSEQKDLPLTDYGGTVTAFDFVYGRPLDCDLTLLHYKQEAIAHHDVYVVQKRQGFSAISFQAQRDLIEKNQRLQAEIDALRGSHSWKVTAPLRSLSRRLKPG